MIEIEQQHGQRLVIRLVAPQQVRRAIQEGAAVGDAAQRIDQRIDLVLELAALLRQVELQEGHDDGEQQRGESQQRERQVAQCEMVAEAWTEQDRRHADQQDHGMDEQNDDQRPARHQWLVAAPPKLLCREQSEQSQNGGHDDDSGARTIGEG
jgi:hypothetical protein